MVLQQIGGAALILIFTLTAITSAWVYQAFMGSTSTPPVATGKNGCRIYLFEGFTLLKNALVQTLSSLSNKPAFVRRKLNVDPAFVLEYDQYIVHAQTFPQNIFYIQQQKN